jgi:hypothetical protein
LIAVDRGGCAISAEGTITCVPNVLTGKSIYGILMVETLRLGVSTDSTSLVISEKSQAVNMLRMLDMAKRASVILNAVFYAVNGTSLAGEHSRIAELLFPMFEQNTGAQPRARAVATLPGGARWFGSSLSETGQVIQAKKEVVRDQP